MTGRKYFGIAIVSASLLMGVGISLQAHAGGVVKGAAIGAGVGVITGAGAGAGAIGGAIIGGVTGN